MSKATTAVVSLLVVACICVLAPSILALLATSVVVPALFLPLTPIAVRLLTVTSRPSRQWLKPQHRLRFRRSVSYAAPALLALLSPVFLWASFGTAFRGVGTTFTTGSVTLNAPEDVIVDSQGNVYIADQNNNQIVEVTAAGVASVVTFPGLSPALHTPTAVAIDGSGNLYVADSNNSRIVELSGGVSSVVATGGLLSYPDGLALDTAGDLFIADGANNNIVEVPAGGTAVVLAITGLGTALSEPAGVAVDVSGNLYIADGGNNRIVEMAPGGVGTVLSITGGVTLNTPEGVAVDGLGNIYVADRQNNRIVTVTPGGGGNVLQTGSVTLLAPEGVAVGVSGTVYVADFNGISEVQDSTVGFGHLPVGAGSGTIVALPFSVGFASTLGSVQAFTLGTASLDFTVVTAGTTCIAGTTDTMSCSVNVQFLPTAAGLRRGSLQLFNNASPNAPIVTVPIYGIGDAPLATLSPGTASVISTGGVATSTPFQMALDGAGNMYVANYSGNNVLKVPPGGGSASVVSTGGITLSDPAGAALDGAGDLFITDHFGNRIVEVTAGGVASVLSITGLSPGLNIPTGLAMDAAGNLYISDYGSGRIVRVTPTGAGSVVATGGFTPAGDSVLGVAVDAAGTVYFPDSDNNRVIKVTAAGAASLVVPAGITPALSSPTGVAVDAFGNLYIGDAGNARIVEVTSAGIALVLSTSGLPSPATLGSFYAIAVDPSGNVLIPDFSSSRLVQANVSGAVLAFPNTDVDTISSPLTATVTNLGNLPLIFATVPTYTANFSENTSDENLCALSTSLVAGTVCDVSVEFTPQLAGPLSASIVVTNNNLNATAATQSVAVGGTGVATADATAVAVSTNPTSVILGQPITITALVTDTTAGHTATIPTGGVTFMDTIGATVVSLNGGAAVTLNGAGQAILTGVTLSGVGVHTITANYAGVVNTFLASSNTTTIAVTAVVTTTTLTAAPNPATVGQSVTLTATIAPAPTGTPLGSVNFFNGATLLGNATVNSSGIATLATASLPVGADSTTAVYSGNAGFATSTSTAVTETVTLAATTTTLIAAPNPAIVGQSVTLTATTMPAPTGTPLGSVNFFNGATLLGNVTVNSSGIATFATAALPLGADSITSVYSGNAGFATSTSIAVSETVTLAATTISLIAAPNPAIFGQSVTLTATVAPAPTGAPLGSVNFFDGATLLGNGTVNASGIATLSTTTLPVGADGITAVYSGNAGFATSTSIAVSETVTLAATTTSLIAAPNPAIVGQSVTLTATVAPLPTGTPLGSVNFFDGATLLGNGTVNSSGVATLTTPILSVGADSMTAVYSGNAGFATSTSTAVIETVTLAATTTTLAATPNPAIVGQSVTLTATISPAPTGTPLGSMNFFNGVTLVGNGTVNTLGIATLATASLPLGTDSITAVYSGNTGFATSTSAAVSEAVTLVVTITTLTVSPTPLSDGQAATLTATVSPAPSGSPVGTLSFYSGSTLLGTAALDASGVATFTTSTLVVGDDSLTAVYAGNGGFAASTSFAVVETVTPSYTVAGPATPATVAPGGTANINITVPPLGGAFDNVVTLSATGLPPGATVTFTPPTVTPGSAGATTVMTIQLGAAVASNTDREFPARHRGFPVAQFSLAFVLFGIVLGRKRIPRTLVLALTLTALGVATSLVTGCGGGFSAPPSYTITVTGTSGSFQASTTVTLKVN